MKNISKIPNQETIQAMRETDMGQTQKISLADLRQEMGLKALQIADTEFANGEGIPYSPELFRQIAKEASENVDKGILTNSSMAMPLDVV